MSLCECGCGQPAPISRYNRPERGQLAGQPVRYISGHNTRRVGYQIEDRGYTTPCWIWQGVPTGDNGYGRVKVNRIAMPAHRYHYERAKGPVPEGLQLDHLCRVPLCVNPDHLEPVTGTENVRRGNVCKLNVEAAEEIRQLCHAALEADPLTTKSEPRRRLPPGVSARIAEQFGISHVTVFSVWKGETWR